ncbi:MAG: hypothetical protein K2K56_11975 [Lachnospiraceae bacterium]|nr:hypothetical protein [Lachnospiraceae bacterium]
MGVKYRKRVYYIFLLLCVIPVLSGCNRQESTGGKEVFVTIEEYQKNVYQTTLVQRGTIEPMLTLRLKPDEYEINAYSINQELLEVEENNVEKGSRVKEGDVMVAFKAEDIEKAIAEYEERKTEDEMLIDHYTKLMKISGKKDYAADVEKLKRDVNIANLYIEEQNQRLSQYRLIAKKGGLVTEVSDELYKGYATAGKTLVRVASGSSDYTASTSDDYEFQVGDIYDAQLGMVVYKMEVVEVEMEGEKNVITFHPVSEMTGVTETDELIMEIHKPVISDAVYVEESAITEVDGKYYAFLLDEDGFRQAAPVIVGDVIDGYAIILKGLEEGERVTLN